MVLLDVLDAEHTLVELRSDYLDALTDYHLAAIEIEGLIGQPLARLGVPEDPQSHAETGELP